MIDDCRLVGRDGEPGSQARLEWRQVSFEFRQLRWRSNERSGTSHSFQFTDRCKGLGLDELRQRTFEGMSGMKQRGCVPVFKRMADSFDEGRGRFKEQSHEPEGCGVISAEGS